MCGIIGKIAADDWGGSLDLDLLTHRGPDGRAESRVGGTGLGHTRLSIIDIAGGAQPMTSVDGSATIVFNGEIYNYRELRSELAARGFPFATASDTEVILGAYLVWGVAGFARLRGMFALALADRRSGETVLARDPFGIKPLFYHRGEEGVTFASEKGAVLASIGQSPAIDRTSVLEVLLHRYPIGTNSLFQGVSALEPGTAMIVSPGGSVRTEKFLCLVEAIERQRQGRVSFDQATVRDRIADTVAHHAIADVPVGCFLSGGLDSSAVAWQLSQITEKPLHAYTVTFDSSGSEASELPFAREVADAIGARLETVTVSGDDFADLAPLLSGSADGPFPDPADIAMFKMSRQAAKDVKVVLSGEGSDEALAGYPKYAFDRYSRFVPDWLPRVLPVNRMGRAGIAIEALAEHERGSRWTGWFQNADAPPSLLHALVEDGAEPSRAASWVHSRVASYPAAWSDMQRMQTLDLESWLPNNLLHRGDFTTMQASLEQRVPFLDLEFTPWAVALPDSAKVKRWRGKRALREAFADRLPRSVIARRKSGFRLPLGEWLTQPGRLREFAHDTLLAPNAALTTWMGSERLAEVLDPRGLSSSKGAKLAWTVLSIELWLRSLSNGTRS